MQKFNLFVDLAHCLSNQEAKLALGYHLASDPQFYELGEEGVLLKFASEWLNNAEFAERFKELANLFVKLQEYHPFILGDKSPVEKGWEFRRDQDRFLICPVIEREEHIEDYSVIAEFHSYVLLAKKDMPCK